MYPYYSTQINSVICQKKWYFEKYEYRNLIYWKLFMPVFPKPHYYSYKQIRGYKADMKCIMYLFDKFE